MLGRDSRSHTAFRIGLIEEVADDLDAAVQRVIAELPTSGPRAAREAKRLVRERPLGEETAQIAARLRAGDEGQEACAPSSSAASPAGADRAAIN